MEKRNIHRKPKKLHKKRFALASIQKGAKRSRYSCVKKLKPKEIEILNQRYRKLHKKRRKRLALMVARRTLLFILTLLILCVFAVYRLGYVLTNGPSETAKYQLVLSLMQASATKWVPELFLSKEEVDSIVEKSKQQSKTVIKVEDLIKNPSDNNPNPSGPQENDPDFWADAIDGMKLIILNGSTYKAYVLLVKDPANVFVGTSTSNYQSATIGAQIFTVVNRYKDIGAVAAINGGEFPDIGGHGKGERPVGLTYSQGKCVWDDGIRRTFIGFDKNNKLIVKNSMTREEADKLGIRDAVCFQTGNVLIDNDGENVRLYYADSDVGTAQRTAIGQTADGTVILLVTDGRTASSLGATRNDVINIMVSFGAVTAGMLDGGSSTQMYYEDYYTKYNIDPDTLDDNQKKGLVNKYKAFTPPRYIPTYFVVKKPQA
ncbi:MAG TPA: phosphodiester glycosidase family protein [Bacillota bacterium]|nr:phosphodiester glycosidase family protein [Bacillota bacterium]HOK69173.1 phosphodiester glycosidase family protein [Bacillota bacterium]HPP85849.1 phosphodiester glycosidase family protein [Bacillota bacterium]